MAGCIGPAASEESVLPCSATDGSPGPAYDAATLRAVTAVRGFDLGEAQARAMLSLVADHLVTPGGRPYDELDAVLARDAGSSDAEVAVWQFTANATWSAGVDAYSLSLYQRGDVVGADFPDDVVEASGWLRTEALRAASALAPAHDMHPAHGAPASATWFADAPGCVRLGHAAEDGGLTYLWLDLGRGALAGVTDAEALPGASPQAG